MPTFPYLISLGLGAAFGYFLAWPLLLVLTVIAAIPGVMFMFPAENAGMGALVAYALAFLFWIFIIAIWAVFFVTGGISIHLEMGGLLIHLDTPNLTLQFNNWFLR